MEKLSDGDRILSFKFKPNSVSVTQFLHSASVPEFKTRRRTSMRTE
jgi:hypothetical protein